MAKHTVRVDVTVDVADEMEVREHAFRLLRQRMNPGQVADQLVEQLTADFPAALKFLVTWQLTGGEGLKGVAGMSVVEVQVPPDA